jgi:hypothetical protein
MLLKYAKVSGKIISHRSSWEKCGGCESGKDGCEWKGLGTCKAMIPVKYATVLDAYNQTSNIQRVATLNPEFLYTRVIGVHGDERNTNGDLFRWGNMNDRNAPELLRHDEILGKPVYATFIGKGNYKDHQNDSVTKAVGILLDAVPNHTVKGIELLIATDRNKDPYLVRGIEMGYVTDVSMGCRVAYSICSICGNVAHTEKEYCTHIRTAKGGEIDGKPVFEDNRGVEFIEESWVTTGADVKAKFLEKIASVTYNVSGNKLLTIVAELEKEFGTQNVVGILNDVKAFLGTKKHFITGGDTMSFKVVRSEASNAPGEVQQQETIKSVEELARINSASSKGGNNGGMAPTDLLALAKSADPYNEAMPTSPIDTLEKEQKDTQSVDQNNLINKVVDVNVEKRVNVDLGKKVNEVAPETEIQKVVAGVKAIRDANSEIRNIFVPKTADSVISRLRGRLRTAETEERPVASVEDGKNRYDPDKGNDIRDQEAQDAIKSDNPKERVKETTEDRPLTRRSKRLELRNRIASLQERFKKLAGDDEAERLHQKPVSYTPDKQDNLDYEKSAKDTESAIGKEHSEREKDTGVKSPLKTQHWSDKRPVRVAVDEPGKLPKINTIKPEGDAKVVGRQIDEVQNALKGVANVDDAMESQVGTLEKKINELELAKASGKSIGFEKQGAFTMEKMVDGTMSFMDKIAEMMDEVSNEIDKHIAETEKKEKKITASIKLAEEGEEHEEKETPKEEKEEHEGKEPKEKKDKKDKAPAGDQKALLDESIDLLKDVKDTADEIVDAIDEHLEGEGETPKGKGKELPKFPMKGKEPLIGEEPLEMPPMGGEMGEGPMPKLPLASRIQNRLQKRADDNSAVIEQIKNDPTLTPDQKWAEIKKLKGTEVGAPTTEMAPMAGHKAIFTKVSDAKDPKIVDKKASYWSVHQKKADGTAGELVIRATVEEMYGEKYAEAYDWASSVDCGKEILANIKEKGLEITAQAMNVAPKMVKTSAQKTDMRAYYKKLYPDKFVSELIKERKKSAELEMKLKTAEEKVVKGEKAQEELTLRTKAEKCLSIVQTAVDKGAIDAKDFDATVDNLMEKSEDGLKSFEEAVVSFKGVAKVASVDESKPASTKAMERIASLTKKPGTLKTAIVITQTEQTLESDLAGMWKKPPVVAKQ